MQTAIRLEIEPVREVGFAAIGVGYTSISVARPSIDHSARMILFQNFTNADLWISKDGVNNHIPLGSRSFILLDIMANQTGQGMSFYIAKGSRFWVKQLEVPTSGSLYMTVFYGAE